jgi:diguanylate cyclase (GGDEF)-like protein
VLAALWLLSSIASTCWAQPVDKGSAQELLDLASSEIRIDPEAGRRRIESALSILQRLPEPDVEIRAHLMLADYYLGRDRDATLQQVAAAETLLPEASSPGLKAGVLTARGRILALAGESDQAAALYDEAVARSQSALDEQLLAEALLSRGTLRGLRGSYALALSDLREAQDLFERHDAPQRVLATLNAIGVTYERMGDAEEATHIFQRTLDSLRAAGLKRDEANTLRDQGDAYESLRQWSLARNSYNAALELGRLLDAPRGQAYALRGLAAVAAAQQDASGALPLLDRAAELQRQTPDVRLMALIELTRGVALHRLNRLKASLTSLSQALSTFHQAGSQNELATTYNELAAVDAELGNWRDAFEYRSLAQTLTTQLLRSQLDQRFESLKVEFDTASKVEENQLLIRENADSQAALAQRQRAGNLQTAVIVLSTLLLAVLATLAVLQRGTSLRLRSLAMTDELTGVPNRRAVLTLLSQMLRRTAEPISILIIDLDHFKSINDRHGHLIGDEALKRVSANLREALSSPAFFGRLGGEEFAAVLPAVRLEHAMVIAEDLRERVLRLDLSRWLGERRVTVSIGIATSQPGRDSISSMLQRADSALYAAKDAGRNCVRSKLTDEEPHAASRVA